MILIIMRAFWIKFRAISDGVIAVMIAPRESTVNGVTKVRKYELATQ